MSPKTSSEGLIDFTNPTTKYYLVIDGLNGKKKIPLDDLPEGIKNPANFTYGIKVEQYEPNKTSTEKISEWAEPLFDNAALDRLKSDCENILEMTIVNATQLKAAKRNLHDVFLNTEHFRARQVLD